MKNKNQKPHLSVIIPNYNESENLKRGVLKEVSDYLKDQSFSYEVIISDDGSTDQSISMIQAFLEKNPQFRLLKNSHAGKPYALKSALKEARGEYSLITDMDQSTPIKELEKLMPWTKQDYKVIIGSRGRGRDSSFFRQIVSVGFWFVRRSIILPNLVDTQCGFKLIQTDLAKKVFSKMQLFQRDKKAQGWKVTAYDVEMLHLAKIMGNEIKEVRVNWKDQDVSEGKSRNFIKESYEMFFEIVRVRINDALGKYA